MLRLFYYDYALCNAVIVYVYLLINSMHRDIDNLYYVYAPDLYGAAP